MAPARGRARGVRELAIFAAAYLTYFGIRALTEGSAAAAHHNARTVIDVERRLGVAVEGDMQRAVVDRPLLVDAANAVYMYGHWPVIIVAGVLLFRRSPVHYYRLRNAFLVTGLLGLAIFALFPVAPPRLTDLPLVDTITREADGYRQLLPASLVNEYAAMPSFHVGWNILLGVVVFDAARRWWLRGLAVLGPAAMALAVVLTANHYVLDVVIGALIVALCLLGLRLAERRRRRGILGHRVVPQDAVRDRPSSGQRRADAPARTRARTAVDRG